MDVLPQKELTGRRLDIATTGGGLPSQKVAAYRHLWAMQGYHVPPWEGSQLPAPKIVTPLPGIGTRIKARLNGWGVTEIACDCEILAKEMDANGPEWCRENIEYLTARMAQNAKKHKWVKFAPFKRLGARQIILRAIEALEIDRERARMQSEIQWAVGMTTAPRKTSTIREALAGARLNDWEPVIFAEPGSDVAVDARVIQHEHKMGIMHNWMHCARWLLDMNPGANLILTMQDDCVLVPNARRLAEQWDWPKDAGLLSLYLPSFITHKPNRRVLRPAGIQRFEKQSFHGSLAVVYRRQTLEAILRHRKMQRWAAGPRPSNLDDDICVGQVLGDLRLRLYYAVPSCSQHISPHSTRKHVGGATGDRCASWVATDALADCVPETVGVK